MNYALLGSACLIGTFIFLMLVCVVVPLIQHRRRFRPLLEFPTLNGVENRYCDTCGRTLVVDLNESGTVLRPGYGPSPRLPVATRLSHTKRKPRCSPRNYRFTVSPLQKQTPSRRLTLAFYRNSSNYYTPRFSSFSCPFPGLSNLERLFFPRRDRLLFFPSILFHTLTISSSRLQ